MGPTHEIENAYDEATWLKLAKDAELDQEDDDPYSDDDDGDEFDSDLEPDEDDLDEDDDV